MPDDNSQGSLDSYGGSGAGFGGGDPGFGGGIAIGDGASMSFAGGSPAMTAVATGVAVTGSLATQAGAPYGSTVTALGLGLGFGNAISGVVQSGVASTLSADPSLAAAQLGAFGAFAATMTTADLSGAPSSSDDVAYTVSMGGGQLGEYNAAGALVGVVPDPSYGGGSAGGS